MLLRLLELLDDLAPHLLRHCGFDRVADLVHLDRHHQQIVAVVPGIDQRLEPCATMPVLTSTLVFELTKVS